MRRAEREVMVGDPDGDRPRLEGVAQLLCDPVGDGVADSRIGHGGKVRAVLLRGAHGDNGSGESRSDGLPDVRPVHLFHPDGIHGESSPWAAYAMILREDICVKAAVRVHCPLEESRR